MSDSSTNRSAVGVYYDSYWTTEGWKLWVPEKVEALLRKYVGPQDSCLDVGCGDGQSTGSWLKGNVASYIGVDVSETAIEMARARGLDARLIDDGGELPFADNSFDSATCTEVLEHLFEPQRALAEIYRTLRPNGRLILTVPNAAHWRNRVDLAVFGRWNPRGDHLSSSEPWRDAHIRFFTHKSLVDLVTSSGFEVRESGGFTVFGLLHFVPGLRAFVRKDQAGSIGLRLAEHFPRFLSSNLYAVGYSTKVDLP